MKWILLKLKKTWQQMDTTGSSDFRMRNSLDLDWIHRGWFLTKHLIWLLHAIADLVQRKEASSWMASSLVLIYWYIYCRGLDKLIYWWGLGTDLELKRSTLLGGLDWWSFEGSHKHWVKLWRFFWHVQALLSKIYDCVDWTLVLGTLSNFAAELVPSTE